MGSASGDCHPAHTNSRRAIAQFHKVDRPVSSVPPSAHPHLVLPGINGDDRSRPDDRVEGVVLKPDVTIKTGFGVELLQKLNRNLSIGLVALGDWAGATPMSATIRRQIWRGKLNLTASLLSWMVFILLVHSMYGSPSFCTKHFVGVVPMTRPVFLYQSKLEFLGFDPPISLQRSCPTSGMVGIDAQVRK
jgi:hypothetical protein